MFFIIKNVFILKNLTDFRKTVETGVDPRLNRTSLDIKVFIIWPRSGRSEVAFAEPEQTRAIPSEQDGSIFAASVTNQKIGFAFSCLVALDF